jgi:hypothetical protein
MGVCVIFKEQIFIFVSVRFVYVQKRLAKLKFLIEDPLIRRFSYR